MNKTKPKFSTELAYVLGVVILAFATAFMTKADFGLSMVVAPAYILHLKLSEYLPFFSFGMAEYTLQAVLLLALIAVLKKFRLFFLFSFVTAVFYGFALDGALWCFTNLPADTYLLRGIWFVLGLVLGAFSIAMMFHTYIAPEVYELFVKELSAKYGFRMHRCKTVYDLVSCGIAILLSFVFFGLWQFEGVKLGTVVCALVNGFLIGRWSAFFEKHFTFSDSLGLRKWFA